SMGAIPDEGDLQQVGAGLDPPDDVHAVGIRYGTVERSAFESSARSVERDGRAIERTSIRPIVHEPADRRRLAEGGARLDEQKENSDSCQASRKHGTPRLPTRNP